ncbi:MAG TPA: hypothetical protein VFJ90_16345 [Candidatus Didemnitutus sp.]|nr:hypothetical protein [Candidatus Didemnitutus sp.]
MKTIPSLRLALGLLLVFASRALLVAADEAPATAAAAPAPQPTAADLQAFVALLRSDLQTQKASVIAENMSFTESEALDFWPLQREYQNAVSQLYDRRLALMRDYLKNGDTLSDEAAKAIAGKVFAWENERTKLKEQWFTKFLAVIPAKKAVRFFQIESQIDAAIDLRLASSLPLIH